MKQLFVTYKEGGLYKKATINEARYKELQGRVEDLILYPSAMLMEQNYSAKCSSGNCAVNTKNILHG